MPITDPRDLATSCAAGAGRIVLLRGKALMDLRPATGPAALFEALDRCRDVLFERAPNATQIWVLSAPTVEALEDQQFGELTQRLFDCFGASRIQCVVLDGPRPDPAVAYLLERLGMQLLPPTASIELIAPGEGSARLELLPFLDSFADA